MRAVSHTNKGQEGNCRYHTFGSVLPGRKFNPGNYRYGFNGKERDPEIISTNGNTYDYGFRIYNPSLGRFLSTDPLINSYPWYSSYHFAGNKPTVAIDLDGLEEYIVHQYYNSKNHLTALKVLAIVDKSGKSQENDIHFKGKDLITDPNVKVLVIKHFADGANGQEFKETLAPNEKAVFDDEKLRTKSTSLNEAKGFGWDEYKGKEFDKTNKIVIAQKSASKVDGYYDALSSGDGSGSDPKDVTNSVNHIKKSVDNQIAEYKAKNGSVPESIQINVGYNTDTKKHYEKVVKELKKTFPDGVIKPKPDSEKVKEGYDAKVSIRVQGKL